MTTSEPRSVPHCLPRIPTISHTQCNLMIRRYSSRPNILEEPNRGCIQSPLGLQGTYQSQSSPLTPDRPRQASRTPICRNKTHNYTILYHKHINRDRCIDQQDIALYCTRTNTHPSGLGPVPNPFNLIQSTRVPPRQFPIPSDMAHSAGTARHWPAYHGKPSWRHSVRCHRARTRTRG